MNLSWRAAIVRNFLLLSALLVSFFAGVYAAEAVGTWLEKGDRPTAQEAPLLFK